MSLEGIQPQYDHRSGTYTWNVKYPKPVKVVYKENNIKKEITLSYPQGLIKTINHFKTALYTFYSIQFAGRTPKTPFNINIMDSGTIEINWYQRSSQKHIPYALQIKPDGIIEIEWQNDIDISDPQTKSVYNEHGDLLYSIRRLSTGYVYELESISPNTYLIRPYFNENSIKRWSSFMMNSTAKVIHI